MSPPTQCHQRNVLIDDNDDDDDDGNKGNRIF